MATDIWEKMLLRGLNIIFSKKKDNLKTEVLESCPEILKENLSSLTEPIQFSVIKSMLAENPDTFDEDFWKSYVDSSLTRLQQSVDPVFIKNNDYWLILLSDIKRRSNTETSWYPVLEKLSLAQKSEKNRMKSFGEVLDKAVQEDSGNLVKIVHKTDIKAYPRELRLSLYQRVIREGSLDTKIARRIRSDSSGDMSKKALRVLFENKVKYDDDDFQNLITQFSDTKHSWVAQYIALNMPTHLTPFLIGLDDEKALKIVEMRMNNV
jgi:hypothetical protein